MDYCNEDLVKILVKNRFYAMNSKRGNPMFIGMVCLGGTRVGKWIFYLRTSYKQRFPEWCGLASLHRLCYNQKILWGVDRIDRIDSKSM